MNFTPLNIDSLPEHAILRATKKNLWFENEDGRTVCVLLAALAMASVFRTKQWDFNLLNNVLLHGDKFYETQTAKCKCQDEETGDANIFNAPGLFNEQRIQQSCSIKFPSGSKNMQVSFKKSKISMKYTRPPSPKFYAPSSIEIASNVLDVELGPAQECVFLTAKNMKGNVLDTNGSLREILDEYFDEKGDSGSNGKA